MKALTLSQLKGRLLYYLSRRDHSVAELKSKILLKNNIELSDFDSAIEWLKNLGYLPNEQDLALRLIKKWQNEGRSLRYIQAHLKKRGLNYEKQLGEPDLPSEHVIQSELDSAKIFLSKKLRGKKLNDLSFEQTQALKRQILTRGFSYETVRSLFQAEKNESRRD